MAPRYPAMKTLMTILFLLGYTSPAEPVALTAATIGQIATVASQVVAAGASLAGTTLTGLADNSYGVTCAIQVENWTKYPLLFPTARINYSGALTTPPFAVLPMKREAFAVRKPSDTATGVSGTVSWEVSGTGRRFVLMWSAPYDFTYHSNWLGLGMTPKGQTQVAPGMEWFNQMYYGCSDHNLKFEREEMYYETDPVIYRDDEFEVVGTMTNVHQAVAKVVFRPSRDNWHNLAGPIRTLLELEEE